jgi:hypothetical protein
MNFSTAVLEFRQALPGTDAFKRVRVQCEQIIRTVPEHATMCFVIGEFCRAYVLFYEDQGSEAGLRPSGQGTITRVHGLPRNSPDQRG